MTYADSVGVRKFYESLFSDEKLRKYYTKMSGLSVNRIKVTKRNFVSGDLKSCYGLRIGTQLIPFRKIMGEVHQVVDIDKEGELNGEMAMAKKC